MSEFKQEIESEAEIIIKRLNELPDCYRLAATLILSEPEEDSDCLLSRGVGGLVSK
jgi:hypothetical protein